MILRKPPRPKRRALRIPPVFELKISLRHIDPLIWRQLLIYGSHHASRPARRDPRNLSAGENYHLYQFELGSRRFEAPEQEEATGEDATAILLMDLDLKPRHEADVPLRFRRRLASHDIESDRHTAGMKMEWNIRSASTARAPVPPEDCGGRTHAKTSSTFSPTRNIPSIASVAHGLGQTHFQPEVFDIRAMNRVLQLAFSCARLVTGPMTLSRSSAGLPTDSAILNTSPFGVELFVKTHTANLRSAKPRRLTLGEARQRPLVSRGLSADRHLHRYRLRQRAKLLRRERYPG